MEEVIYFEFNEKWIKDNQLIIVISNIDMSINFCVTAKKSWVEKNCPNLLTTYKKFLRMLEEDEPSYGNFGCPFLEYNEENIGIHYAYKKEDNQGYSYYDIDPED